jgi:hypothetical protein
MYIHRNNRLIRVRKLMYLLSIFCVFSLNNRVLLCLHMLLTSSPAVSEISRDIK